MPLTNSCPVLKVLDIAIFGNWKLLHIYTCNQFLILMECIYYVNFTHNNNEFNMEELINGFNKLTVENIREFESINNDDSEEFQQAVLQEG